jgi:hypothetical protein
MQLIDQHKAAWANVKNKPAHKRTASYKVWKQLARMDMEQLKAIPEHADRIAPKAKMIAKYRDYLTEFMATSDGEQNDVLFLNMVWAGDTGKDDAWMLELADFAHNTDQKPVKPWFKSDPASLIADQVFQKTDKSFRDNGSISETFTQIFERIINKTWTVHTFTRARYHRLMGLFNIELEQWDAALENLIIANELKDDIGVKGRIKTLTEGTDTQKKALKKPTKRIDNSLAGSTKPR